MINLDKISSETSLFVISNLELTNYVWIDPNCLKNKLDHTKENSYLN